MWNKRCNLRYCYCCFSTIHASNYSNCSSSSLPPILIDFLPISGRVVHTVALPLSCCVPHHQATVVIVSPSSLFDALCEMKHALLSCILNDWQTCTRGRLARLLPLFNIEAVILWNSRLDWGLSKAPKTGLCCYPRIYVGFVTTSTNLSLVLNLLPVDWEIRFLWNWQHGNVLTPKIGVASLLVVMAC